MSAVTPAEDARSVMINQVSWGAIFAGAVIAVSAQVVLNMVGVGVGAATLDPGTGDNPTAGAFGIGAGIWFAISTILAALLGGVGCWSSVRQTQTVNSQVAQALSQAQGIPVPEAQQQIEEYQAQFTEAVDTAQAAATEAADTATKAATRGALLAAVVLILGALAGWFGGRMGVVEPVVTARRRTI